MTLGGDRHAFLYLSHFGNPQHVSHTSGAFGARYFGKYIRKKQKEVQESLGETGRTQRISWWDTHNFSIAAEQRVAKIFTRKTTMFTTHQKDGIVSSFYDGSEHFAANFAVIVVLLKGGSLVVTGDITAGSLLVFAVFDLCRCTYCNAWLILL